MATPTDLTGPVVLGVTAAAAAGAYIYAKAKQIEAHPLNQAALAERRQKRADKKAARQAVKDAKQAAHAAVIRGWIDAKDGTTDPHYIDRSIATRRQS